MSINADTIRVQNADGSAVTDANVVLRVDAANNYTITPPTKPLTFEDVTPMTEAPPKGTVYWVICPWEEEGVFGTAFSDYESDYLNIKRRMAYLDKEHALIAARHIFGLKGGEL